MHGYEITRDDLQEKEPLVITFVLQIMYYNDVVLNPL